MDSARSISRENGPLCPHRFRKAGDEAIGHGLFHDEALGGDAALSRVPFGFLLIAGGVMWFMPVVGIEMLPIGLLIIAMDVPFLRQPVGRGTPWLLDRWVRLRRWWAQRRAERQTRPG